MSFYLLNDRWWNKGDVIIDMKIASKTTTLMPVTERPRNHFGWQTLKPVPGDLDKLWDNGKIVIRNVPKVYDGNHYTLNDWEDGTYTLYRGGEPYVLVPTEEINE